MVRSVRLAVLLAIVTLLVGCVTTFPSSLMQQVDLALRFDQLAATPDAYRGRLVMVGGEVIRTEPGPEGTELEILQRPVAYNGFPRLFGESRGRFLVRVPESLKTAAAQPGWLVAVVGDVQGAKDRCADHLPYLEARDLKAWPSSAAFPSSPYPPSRYWRYFDWPYSYWGHPPSLWLGHHHHPRAFHHAWTDIHGFHHGFAH